MLICSSRILTFLLQINKKNQCLQEADDVAGILWDILVTPFTFYKDYFDSVFVATVSGDYNLITDAITR